MNGVTRTALSTLLPLSLLVASCSADGGGTSLAQVDPNSDSATTGSDTTAGPGDATGPSDPDDDASPECWEGIKLCEGAGVKTCEGGVWSDVEPCAEGACVNGECTDCVPDCDGAACGPDGCGGSCGACEGDGACEDGQCPCVPDCEDRVCGSDGCGGSCGFCDAGLACVDGGCDCAPACDGKECGPNGCGGECGICQGDFECTASGECAPAAYRAVLIQDHWSSGCSNYNSSGADIDAVSLYDADGELVSYFIEVIEEVGKDQCTNSYTDPNQVAGPPDGTDDGCIALQGGWIMGRFADYVPITSGMTLIVHEFGQQQGGSSEPFSVYLATGFDCAESDDPGACSVLLTSEGYGPTEVSVP